MLDHALQYAGRGWSVFRLSGHKTPLKGTHGHRDATTDPALVEQWWNVRHPPNIGLACGEIIAIDLDGSEAIARMTALAAPHGGLPPTLTQQTSRGLHLLYRAPAGVTIRTRNEPRELKGADGIDIKGRGGYIVLSPSVNAKTGFTYKWLHECFPAVLPDWLVEWIQTNHGRKSPAIAQPMLGPQPAYLEQLQAAMPIRSFKATAPWSPEEEARIWSALEAIPARGYDQWREVGMALHSLDWTRPDGTSPAFELFDDWSATEGEQYNLDATEKKWNSFGKRSGIGLGTLFHLAEQHGWQGNLPREIREEVVPHPVSVGPSGQHNEQPHSAFMAQGGAVDLKVNGHHAGPTLLPGAFVQPNSDSPLIELNEKYAVIGDVGSKCLVMGWVPSKIDNGLAVPSFQNFQAFTQRYANRYVEIRKPKGEEWVMEPTQLGAHWLKWKARRTYEGIDLVPGAETLLPGNVLNLWRGFGVPAQAGEWPLMKAHIANVLANGNVEAMQYIMRWTAWTVQNPGERAEAALVFRGGKGSGKGIFANALRSIFGSHGLSVSNSKHLVGAFNGHLRNCLLLFADEAFWAGDKQGESVLKAILTEPLLTIEQKGIDAAPWKNRLHVLMAANSSWVIPASHDERRFAMFDSNNAHIGDENYFKELHHEMKNGGLSAMLHDMLALDLKGWHPRRVPQTEALQFQKQRSLDALHEWYEGLLQDGSLPGIGTKGDALNLPAGHLLHTAKEAAPKLRDVSGTALGRFLRSMGCIKMRNATHNSWKFPSLSEARGRWMQTFGAWKWENDSPEWTNRV